jgi:hypothetical protein
VFIGFSWKWRGAQDAARRGLCVVAADGPDGFGAQVRGEPPFECAEHAHDDEVQAQIDEGRTNEHLGRAVGLLDDLLCDAGDLPHRHEARERGRFDQQHGLGRISGQTLAQCDRPDHAAQQREARQPIE